MNTLQRGFTMVELLVTLAIAAFLTAGLSALLVQSKQTYKTQQTVSHMMEDGRYVLEVLSKESRRIGFLRNKHAAGGAANQVFVVDIDALGSGINLGSGAFIGGAYSAGGFGGNTYNVNKLVFRYQLNDATELRPNTPNYANSPCTRLLTLIDTDGDGVVDPGEDPATTIHVVTIYLYVGVDNTNTQVLYCRSKRETIDTSGTKTLVKPNTITAEPLLSNVERFLVLYGVDTDNTPDGEANIYVAANSIPDIDPVGAPDGVADWSRVVSVRLYTVLFSDETNVVQGTPSYRINGQSVTPDDPEDRRLYRVFSTTISSRNR